MHQPGADTWHLPETLSVQELLSALATECTTVADPEYSATVVYADTFDWRLYQQGFILHCHERAWTLYHGDSSEVTLLQGGPELHRACFARDFPPGRLRELLEPLAGIRSLLPLATVTLKGVQLRILNRDEKTVARIVIEQQQAPDSSPPVRLLRLFPIRGYDQELGVVRTLLHRNGVREPASPLAGFHQGCRTAGRVALDYSSKFALELDPHCSARQAMVQIYQALLAQIERNIPGVLDDLDTEFLHDLRVAVRRTRSGLSLVKRVLPPPVVEKFKTGFGLLGTLTGPTRDLDVYLLKQEAYLARLPPALQPGLIEFFAGLAARRRVEQARLVRGLRAKASKAVLRGWQRYLHSIDPEPAQRADKPVRDLAGRIIHRHFKRVLKDGQALDSATPDTEVHRLRIQCKKLRYAMEFFSSLYPKDEIQQLVRQLKKLQDILGAFNDLSVQQLMLRTSLDKLRASSRRNVAMAAALGGLMQSLYQEQQELRTHFAEVFSQFSDPVNTALVDDLFRKKQDPS